MLRTLYFAAALFFAMCFTIGGIGGVVYEAYLLLNDLSADEATSQMISLAFTGGGAIGYIICSFLFVREDDEDDTDIDDPL